MVRGNWSHFIFRDDPIFQHFPSRSFLESRGSSALVNVSSSCETYRTFKLMAMMSPDSQNLPTNLKKKQEVLVAI